MLELFCKDTKDERIGKKYFLSIGAKCKKTIDEKKRYWQQKTPDYD